jgi:hypothetical protein
MLHSQRTWLFTVAMFCVVVTPIAQAEDFEVFLIGGQSNGTGRADSSELTGVLAAPQTDVYFYWHQGLAASNAALTDDTLLALEPGSGHGTAGTDYPNEFGPEVSFGRSMADEFPDHNIFIIKATWGGTNLHTEWSATGDKYANFVDTTTAGLAALTSAGHTYHMAGMLWQQGEADQSDPYAANYEANLTDLVSRARTDLFGGGSAPFVLGMLSTNQTNYDQSPGSGFQTIRTAQTNVAAADAYVAAVNTDTYTVRADNVHFDASGQVDLGEGLADAMIPLVSFNAPSGKAPPAPVDGEAPPPEGAIASYNFDNAWTGAKETNFAVVSGNSPSVDTDLLTTAADLQNSGFTDGGYDSYVVDDTAAGTSIFDGASVSESPGLNLGGANQTTATKYISFTITPDADITVTYESLTVYTETNAAGDRYFHELRVVDGGGDEQSLGIHDYTTGGAANEPVHLATFDFTDFDSTNVTEWRLYGWATAGVNNGIRVDDITLYGTSVPEPGTLTVLLVAGIPLVLRRKRK